MYKRMAIKHTGNAEIKWIVAHELLRTSTAREHIIVYQGPTGTEYHEAAEHVAPAPNHEEVNSLKA